MYLKQNIGKRRTYLTVNGPDSDNNDILQCNQLHNPKGKNISGKIDTLGVKKNLLYKDRQFGMVQKKEIQIMNLLFYSVLFVITFSLLNQHHQNHQDYLLLLQGKHPICRSRTIVLQPELRSQNHCRYCSTLSRIRR